MSELKRTNTQAALELAEKQQRRLQRGAEDEKRKELVTMARQEIASAGLTIDSKPFAIRQGIDRLKKRWLATYPKHTPLREEAYTNAIEWALQHPRNHSRYGGSSNQHTQRLVYG